MVVHCPKNSSRDVKAHAGPDHDNHGSTRQSLLEQRSIGSVASELRVLKQSPDDKTELLSIESSDHLSCLGTSATKGN